jgi:hypothetical protein
LIPEGCIGVRYRRLPLGYLQMLCLIFAEAADGLGPTPDTRNILADRFGPDMAGECTLTREGVVVFRGNKDVAFVKASPKMA